MFPPGTLRLNTVCDAGNLAHNAFGLHAYIVERGWEASFAERPWGASDIPSVDETIAAGFGFVQSWATGIYADGKNRQIGKYPVWPGKAPAPVECTPRGLDAFAEMDARWPGFVAAARKRTDASRAVHAESALYVGGVKLGTIPAYWSKSKRTATIDGWLAWVLEAGFDWLMLDAVFADDQGDGTAQDKTMNMHLAERALVRGLKVAGEPGETCTPGLFPWFNGRFAGITGLEQMTAPPRNGPGWFGPACPGVCTEWFCWINGGYAAEVRAIAPAARPERCCVEFGGVPVASWKR